MEFRWDNNKDTKIQFQDGRFGIGFDDIVDAIEDWWLLDFGLHPKQDKYPW